MSPKVQIRLLRAIVFRAPIDNAGIREAHRAVLGHADWLSALLFGGNLSSLLERMHLPETDKNAFEVFRLLGLTLRLRILNVFTD